MQDSDARSARSASPKGGSPQGGQPGPATAPTVRPAHDGVISLDLSAWPQVQCQIPATVPLGLAIQATELMLSQLRELYIQSEIQRRTQQPIADRAVEHDVAQTRPRGPLGR